MHWRLSQVVVVGGACTRVLSGGGGALAPQSNPQISKKAQPSPNRQHADTPPMLNTYQGHMFNTTSWLVHID